MRRRLRSTAAVASGAALGLVLAACGGSSGNGGGGTGGGSGGAAAFDQGNTAVVNASTKTGGTLRYALSDEPDSTDPGNTYYGYMWDFSRLYARTLLTFTPAPGDAGLKLAPDLATGPGQVSADGKTWTYKLRSGLKYEDGSPVTSKDVKYAVERTYARDILPNGPEYFTQYLGTDYPGPYKDKAPDKLGLKAVETPDDTTVVFKLQQPFADFDYLVTNPQVAPVPPAKDTGAKYQQHPWSTGPYKFDSYSSGKSFTLVKNTNWDAGTDPNRKQLADRIEVQLKVNPEDLDKRLLNGDVDVELSGLGVQAATRSTLLRDPKQKANADTALSGRLWYVAMSQKVAPFDNLHCRRAVLYAADKTAQQTAWAGPIAGGDIATTVIPPNVVGYQKSDQYGLASHPAPDVAKAKDELSQCGKPSGFATKMTVRADRPKEVAAAQALQQSLAKVGIKVELLQYPQGRYFSTFAGVPNYVHQQGAGLLSMGWQADWPTGFGFLQQIADGAAIKAAGNSNLSETNDPQVNSLLAKAASTTDTAARNGFYGDIDKRLMDQAQVLPEVYAKSLFYRPASLTNVYVTPAYGLYDYTQLGKK